MIAFGLCYAWFALVVCVISVVFGDGALERGFSALGVIGNLCILHALGAF